MRKKIISLAFLAILAILLIKLFLPKDYPVLPATPRAGTQYWHLSTGSNIAYTLVPAEGPKKPHPIIYLHGGPGGPISD